MSVHLHLHLHRPVAWRHAYRSSAGLVGTGRATVGKDFSALPTCGGVRPLASQLALRNAQAAGNGG